MANRARYTLRPLQANYLKSEIESGSLVRIKQALQHLCKLCRNGGVLPPENRVSMENAILGALSSAASDEKIRRWALSALTHVGRPNVSQNAVLRALSDYPDEPQVLAAAIACLFKFDSKSAQKIISNTGICTAEMIALSALQTADPKQLELAHLKIDIENAEPVPLKLALLLIGLDRAPEHLFDPRHTNANIVKELGGHHEAIVSQYSVWAAAENPRLGAADIGINVADLDSYAPNVRSYVYRLFAEDSLPSTQRHGIILQGREDYDREAKLGLAIGLRDSFYDGLQDITVNWFHDEDDADIKAHVLDHIVAQAERVPSYEKTTFEQYELAAGDIRKRLRMEAAAATTTMYRELKRRSVELEAGMLGLMGVNVTNNTFVNNGSMQGAVSQSGEAVNHGTMQLALTQGQIQDAWKLLDGVITEIEATPLSDELKGEVRHAVGAAKENTDKEALGRVVDLLQKAENGLKAVSGMADHAIKIGTLVLGLSVFT